MALLMLTACSSARSTDPPPTPPSAIAQAAYQARGVHIAAQMRATPEPQGFPLVAPDPPFGAPPSSQAPLDGPSPVPSATSRPGMQL